MRGEINGNEATTTEMWNIWVYGFQREKYALDSMVEGWIFRFNWINTND